MAKWLLIAACTYPEIRVFTGSPSVTYRRNLELPVFKSPGDKATYQRNSPTPDASVSAYEDVGSSYQYNGRWYNQVSNTSQANWSPYSVRLCKAFGVMCDSSLVNTSQFVMFHDQSADVISNDTAGRNWKTEFGDLNKSVMSFLDAHVDYVTVKPNADSGTGYTFRFPLIDRIRTGVTP